MPSIFEEYGSYYLLGYETTNGDPDGKFRRIDVDVSGRDLQVQAKSGRWAPNRDSVTENDGPQSIRCVFDCWHQPPPPSAFHLVGLMPVQPLRMRAALYPVGRAAVPAGGRSNAVEIAAVLTVRMPAVIRAVDDVLTVVRTSYEAGGRASAPEQIQLTQHLVPEAGDETRYEVLFALRVAAGTTPGSFQRDEPRRRRQRQCHRRRRGPRSVATDPHGVTDRARYASRPDPYRSARAAPPDRADDGS